MDDHAASASTTTTSCKQSQWLAARADPRAAGARSCAGWCATPTATSPTTASGWTSSGSRPETSATLEDLHKLPLLDEGTTCASTCYFDILSDNHDKRTHPARSPPAAPPASRSSATPTAPARVPLGGDPAQQEWTGYRFGDRAVRLWHQTIGMTQAPDRCASASTPGSTAGSFIPVFEMSDDELEQLSRTLRRAPARADRRLRRVRSTSSPTTSQRRAGLESFRPKALDLVGADAARAEPRDHRGGVRLRRVRQVRQPRVLRHRLRVRRARRATTSWPRATSSRSLKDGAPGRARARSARS